MERHSVIEVQLIFPLNYYIFPPLLDSSCCKGADQLIQRVVTKGSGNEGRKKAVISAFFCKMYLRSCSSSLCVSCSIDSIVKTVPEPDTKVQKSK